jgi:hypothetical protein
MKGAVIVIMLNAYMHEIRPQLNTYNFYEGKKVILHMALWLQISCSFYKSRRIIVVEDQKNGRPQPIDKSNDLNYAAEFVANHKEISLYFKII